MAFDIPFHPTLLGVFLFLLAGTQAANKTDNTPTEEMAGWKEGPNSRGTLNLVWSCGITIFACTWTVTHLNLPSPKDTALQKFIRRFKWMSINIMFPEFILSKAICDLRQALDELRQFDQTLHSIEDGTTIAWTDRFPHLTSGSDECISKTVNRNRSWEVKYPPCYKILCRLLGLEAFSPETSAPSRAPSDVEMGNPNQSQHPQTDSPNQASNPLSRTNRLAYTFDFQDIPLETLGQPDVTNLTGQTAPLEAPQPDSQATGFSRSDVDSESVPVMDDAPQKWTISHSYYAQMGGILIPSEYTKVWTYRVLTAAKLTSQYRWNESEEHPLKYLELSEKDIQDKSKADWLLKSLAMLQIIWLVLDVTVRGITGLHITQLEVATFAFALMAILTYVACCWKPKDVSEPTYILHSHTGAWKVTPQMRQLSLWFQSPAKAADPSKCKSLHEGDRIPNDAAWMGVDIVPMTLFLAFSSFVFGGIHCLAWNFEFPSRVELILWRSGCIIAAILPGITLGISILLSHLSARSFEAQRQILVEEFARLPYMTDEWWNALLDPQLDNLHRGNITLQSVPDLAKTWKTRIHPPKESVSAFYRGHFFALFLYSFITIRRCWEQSTPDRADLEDWLSGCTNLKENWNLLRTTQEDWRLIELSVNYEYGDEDWRNGDRSYITELLAAIDRVQQRFAEEHSFSQKAVSQASNALSIISYLVYSVTRLLILVLLFTSLRHIPSTACKVTPWVNLLPKIS